jgi:L-aspartate oxidase
VTGLTSAQWTADADVLVVGSGAAGISAALAAAARGARVLLIAKDLVGGATPLAQGGLAAAIGPGDDPSHHAGDTLEAGVGLCDAEIVAALTAAAPDAIAELVRRGARLERVALRREGGHRRSRIVHSGNDATGAEVHRVLLAALADSRVEVLDRTVALDLIAGGLRAAAIGPDGRTLRLGEITGRTVVLAAGGLGQAYATTTNPHGATGDGLVVAARAGALLRDPEFVQFHPTVLWQAGAGGQRPLITEALRGAGAMLFDHAGRPLMRDRHPLGDLAPRDVVAAAMQERISSGDPHLWLDATKLDRRLLEDGFPTVVAACRDQGTDPVTDPIPVAPGAHYSCGGVLADLDGRTSVPGLYAVGEVASTGVHGANRLASNSVTEALIAGRRAGLAAAGEGLSAGSIAGRRAGLAAAGEGLSAGSIAGRRAGLAATLEGPSAGSIAGRLAGLAAAAEGPSAVTFPPVPAVAGELLPPQDPQSPLTDPAATRAAAAAAMSRHAGVIRDAAGLTELLATLTPPPVAGTDLVATEAANLCTVSLIIAAAALNREESRGCHRRSDAPAAQERPWHTLVAGEVVWQQPLAAGELAEVMP